MAKSIRLKNNVYLASSGIRIETFTPTFNNEYVYDTDLDYVCFKIGNLVFIQINTIAFKKDIPNLTEIITNIPATNMMRIGYLLGRNNDTYPLRIDVSGTTIRTHWTTVFYGSSSNIQYSGLIIYTTNSQ